MDTITTAAAIARTLFLHNEWTWKDDVTAPSALDIEATYSSLRWEIERAHGDERGRTRFATTGRLMVVRDPDGNYRYSVETGTQHS